MNELLNIEQSFRSAARLCGAEIAKNSSISIIDQYLGKRSFILEPRYKQVKDLVNRELPVISLKKEGVFMRDCGAVVLIPQNNQEVIDLALQTVKVCEKTKIPGIIHSFSEIREEVSLPTEQSLNKFFVKPRKRDVKEKKPDLEKKMKKASKYLEKTAERWYKKYKRNINPIEVINKSEKMIVSYGLNARVFESLLEEDGEVGLIKIRALRPWPEIELPEEFIIVDHYRSPGRGGLLHSEIGLGDSFVTPIITKKEAIDLIEKLKGD